MLKLGAQLQDDIKKEFLVKKSPPPPPPPQTQPPNFSQLESS